MIENKDRPLSPRQVREYIRNSIQEWDARTQGFTEKVYTGMRGIIRSVMGKEFADDKVRKCVLYWLTQREDDRILYLREKSTTSLCWAETMAIYDWMGIEKIRTGMWIPLDVWRDEYMAVIGLVSGILNMKNEEELLDGYDKYFGEIRQSRLEESRAREKKILHELGY